MRFVRAALLGAAFTVVGTHELPPLNHHECGTGAVR